jgi:hypothetical protein
MEADEMEADGVAETVLYTDADRDADREDELLTNQDGIFTMDDDPRPVVKGRPDYSRQTLQTKRGGRVLQSSVPDYITLTAAKYLIKYELGIGEVIDVAFVKTVISPRIVSNFMNELICLHLNIMFSSELVVFRFLTNYKIKYGIEATELLINHSIQENCIHLFTVNSFNALSIAALWTNNPNMIRILYKFGADMAVIGANGLFVEELHSVIPFYNHLSNYIPYNNINLLYNHVWGYRLVNNFMEIIQEIRIICGEIAPTPHYIFPIKYSWGDRSIKN